MASSSLTNPTQHTFNSYCFLQKQQFDALTEKGILVVLKNHHLLQFHILDPNQSILSGLNVPKEAFISLAGKRLTSSVTLRDLGLAKEKSCMLQMEYYGGLLGGSTSSKVCSWRSHSCLLSSPFLISLPVVFLDPYLTPLPYFSLPVHHFSYSGLPVEKAIWRQSSATFLKMQM